LGTDFSFSKPSFARSAHWADWDVTKRHYELMARFVHPHFQKSRDLSRASYDYVTSHHGDFIGQAGAAIQAEIDRHTVTPPTPKGRRRSRSAGAD